MRAREQAKWAREDAKRAAEQMRDHKAEWDGFEKYERRMVLWYARAAVVGLWQIARDVARSAFQAGMECERDRKDRT